MTEATHVANLREQAERQQFDTFMQRNIARLTTHAQPYIGRMVPSQRHDFLKFALEQAWATRAELKPRKTAFAEEHIDILHWWEERCLKPAARTRREWTLRTWDGQREILRGTALGRSS
ncbi:MAG: hypothetical protein ACREXP_03390 [Steroidobacteraceae bacterium]